MHQHGETYRGGIDDDVDVNGVPRRRLLRRLSGPGYGPLP